MGKIKQLAPHEVHKIAAGEVIEKPAHIVKELVENALDAGASAITVFVENGGKALIRIIDNGCGMSSDDACMSLVHHATSKITSIEDLSYIQTYGFRGEALSSIASVTSMTMITREGICDEGVKLTVQAGSIVKQEQIACTVGTELCITNLFDAVPARRKFLRTDEVEWRSILQLMQAYAIVQPTISFTLHHNNKRVFHAQACDTSQARIPMIHDAPLVQAALDCAACIVSGTTLSGWITHARYARYDRSLIFFFVNKRWVKNTKLTHAFLKGYAGILPQARYPAGAVFIDIAADQVDINIHPRKEEVKFLNPHHVERGVATMVQEALNKNTTQLIGKGDQMPNPPMIAQRPINSFSNNTTEIMGQYEQQPVSLPDNVSQEVFRRSVDAALDPSFPSTTIQDQTGSLASCRPSYYQESLTHQQKSCEYRLIGTLKNTYILLETAEGLTLIDQHAAHERVLYELFSQRFSEVSVVPLLFPLIIQLSSLECELIVRHQHIFEAHGITLQLCGPNQCAVTALPVMLKDRPIDDLVKQIIGLLGEYDVSTKKDSPSDDLPADLYHNVRAQMACKSAVKAGDTLDASQIQSLIDSLDRSEHKGTCPHGRPTLWALSWYDLERLFKRKI